jgi:hypothetical protein
MCAGIEGGELPGRRYFGVGVGHRGVQGERAERAGRCCIQARSELGESLASVQKFDVPLEQAITFSLDALKQYSLGNKVREQVSREPHNKKTHSFATRERGLK